MNRFVLILIVILNVNANDLSLCKLSEITEVKIDTRDDIARRIIENAILTRTNLNINDKDKYINTQKGIYLNLSINKFSSYSNYIYSVEMEIEGRLNTDIPIVYKDQNTFQIKYKWDDYILKSTYGIVNKDEEFSHLKDFINASVDSLTQLIEWTNNNCQEKINELAKDFNNKKLIIHGVPKKQIVITQDSTFKKTLTPDQQKKYALKIYKNDFGMFFSSSSRKSMVLKTNTFDWLYSNFHNKAHQIKIEKNSLVSDLQFKKSIVKDSISDMDLKRLNKEIKRLEKSKYKYTEIINDGLTIIVYHGDIIIDKR